MQIQNNSLGLQWWDLLFQREDGNKDEHVGDEGEEEDGGEDAQLRHLPNMNILAWSSLKYQAQHLKLRCLDVYIQNSQVTWRGAVSSQQMVAFSLVFIPDLKDIGSENMRTFQNVLFAESKIRVMDQKSASGASQVQNCANMQVQQGNMFHEMQRKCVS